MSFNDYPDEVRKNARRGLQLNLELGNRCATQVGKVRGQQLARGKPVSGKTVRRMYSYLSRAKAYDNNDPSKCGTVSYLLWGGDAALEWSKKKLGKK